jgi:hypothetical protein
MSASDYEKQKYLAGAEAARRCMAQLREHFDTVTLNAGYTDASGNEITMEIDWSDDDDEDEEKAK